ncbi:ABC transporter ATP-binding protein [Pelagibius litoralis]|uniref:ABC transporter ATP-binding protein n=1 Tax=Pelagibius litoralis TaxID=374515 RepID=A0A967CAK5_9PROT|nr:ABC transporter ATP-binding protein [Pelagibius litoralis]NIA67738.1 ABC transporter ATP-binding protein [Pelagibius litoralis]
MLRIDGLVCGYGGSQVLRGLDLQIAAGESVALLGRNGMGKTTLLRAIMGLLPAKAGKLWFDDRRIDGTKTEAIAKAGLAFVPQGREIFPDLTVAENLQLGAMGRRGLGAGIPQEIFQRFPILAERLKQKGGTLSGGQQQQLAIGRALAGQPKMLLLDEPSDGLQPSIVTEVGRAMRREVEEQGLTLITVEQNVALALAIAERCLFIENGILVAETSSAALRADDSLIHRYLAI